MTKLEELRQQRIAEEKKQAEAAKEALEKQLIADEERVAELRRPGMKSVDLGRRVALVSKPSHLEFERFMDTKLQLQDTITFLRHCVVYPPVDELYESYPAYLGKLATAAGEMLGLEREAIRGE